MPYDKKNVLNSESKIDYNVEEVVGCSRRK
jgi:hypothetical protein